MNNEMYELTRNETNDVTGGVPFGALPLVVISIDPAERIEASKNTSSAN